MAVPEGVFAADPLRATNDVLRALGGPPVVSFDDEAQVLRAVVFLEGEVE
jgi:hypothetical protein